MFFFFNDTATTEIYTLSLHDALPIFPISHGIERPGAVFRLTASTAPRKVSAVRSSARGRWPQRASRSEEHTSELQSRQYLVCRLLLEKKKNNKNTDKASTQFT